MNIKVMSVLFALFLLAACTAEKSIEQSIIEPKPEGRTVQIDMIAKNWAFEPNEIRVKKGDHVKINVQSTDVAHGIGIEGYAESVKFDAGASAVLEFTADKVGEFRFYCNVFCGEGHRSMAGKLIVEE
jgi:cytochrome c oxidase subunit 2